MTSQRRKESGATTTRRAMTLQAANAALNYDDPATVTAKGAPELSSVCCAEGVCGTLANDGNVAAGSFTSR